MGARGAERAATAVKGRDLLYSVSPRDGGCGWHVS